MANPEAQADSHDQTLCFAIAALESEYVAQWPSTPRGVVAPAFAALLVVASGAAAAQATHAEIASAALHTSVVRDLAFAACMVAVAVTACGVHWKRKYASEGAKASATTRLGIAAACLGLLLLGVRWLASARESNFALVTVAASSLLLAHIPSQLPSYIELPFARLRRASHLASSATAAAALTSSVAAALSSRSCICARVVSLASLVAGGLWSRRDIELDLRELFLHERRVHTKAHQFYKLLSSMLPPPVVQRYFECCLDDGPAAITSVCLGEHRPHCGILFVAICDFDKVVTRKKAKFVVNFLNRIFSAFDAECEAAGNDITKVETVGEVYVCASGIFTDPESQADQLGILANLALRMHEVGNSFKVRLRAGLHAGPIVAGIVGDRLPRFRLFGDTMNTAARLEQHCPPGQSLLSKKMTDELDRSVFDFEEHKQISMKGLGDVTTYLLRSNSAEATVLASFPAAATVGLVTSADADEPGTDAAAASEGVCKVKALVRFGEELGANSKQMAERGKTLPPKSQSWDCSAIRQDSTTEEPLPRLLDRCTGSDELIHELEEEEEEKEEENSFLTARRKRKLLTAPCILHQGLCENESSESEALEEKHCSSLTLASTQCSTLTGDNGFSTIGQNSTLTGHSESNTSDSDCNGSPDPTPSHQRRKTPTDWLSPEAQLPPQVVRELRTRRPSSEEGPEPKLRARRFSTEEISASGVIDSCNPDPFPDLDDGEHESDHDDYKPVARSTRSCSVRSCRSESSVSCEGRFPAGSSDDSCKHSNEDGLAAPDPLEAEVRQRINCTFEEEILLQVGGLLSRFKDGTKEASFQDEHVARALSSMVNIVGTPVAALARRLVSVAEASFEQISWHLFFSSAGDVKQSPLSSSRMHQFPLQQVRPEMLVLCMALLTTIAYFAGVSACPLSGDALALAPWSWALLCFAARLPFTVVMQTCIVVVSVAALKQPCVEFLLAAIALAILQWADERVQRRHFLVRSLEKDTRNGMQALAESLMPPCVIEQLRGLLFSSAACNAFCGLPTTPKSPGSCKARVAHYYELVTCLQADLVGFTSFARSKAPEEVVCVINGLFSIFDSCVDQRAIYKMETIGDAYVCISGLPDDGEHSATAMVLLASDFIDKLAIFKKSCCLPSGLGLRVGIHSGSCVGGIVGATMQRYHLFGRTVHIAEVLESTAPTDGVHLSETTKASVDRESGQWNSCLRFSLVDPRKDLMTSKGELVQRSDIDNLRTYLVDMETTKGVDRSKGEACAASAPVSHLRRRRPSIMVSGESQGSPAKSEQAATEESQRGIQKLHRANFGASHMRSLEQLDLAVRWHAKATGRFLGEQHHWKQLFHEQRDLPDVLPPQQRRSRAGRKSARF